MGELDAGDRRRRRRVHEHLGQEHRGGHRVAERARGAVPDAARPRAAAARRAALGRSRCRRSAASSSTSPTITAVDNNSVPRDLREPRAGDDGARRSTPRRRSARSTSPSDEVARDADAVAARERRRAVTLDARRHEPDLEFSYRARRGTWSRVERRTAARRRAAVFWLPGVHTLEVRAREIGNPETIDTTPVELELPIGIDRDPQRPSTRRGVPFHGQAGASGCSCDTAASAGGAAARARADRVCCRRAACARRVTRAHEALVGCRIGAVARGDRVLPGCSCGNASRAATPSACRARSSTAVRPLHEHRRRRQARDGRDLRSEPRRPRRGRRDRSRESTLRRGRRHPRRRRRVYDPSTLSRRHRGARARTSARGRRSRSASGLARVAYQDRDSGALKFALRGRSADEWKNHVIDGGDE